MRESPERNIFRSAYAVLFITLALMTWAYMSQAHSLKSVVSHHSQNRMGSLFESNHPSCYFNQLCTCSNPGPDLGIVTCAYIPLASVPLALNNSRILTLSLVGNYLQVLDDRRFVRSGVRRLEIKENNLHYITSGAFVGLERSLWELDLGKNELTTVPSDAMRYLTKLELIDLSGNQISELSANDFRGLEGSLVSVSLADNLIHTINEGTFSKLTNLKVLDLSGNKIFEIKSNSFPPRPTFTTLTLSDNQLKSIPFPALQSLTLKRLDLSQNVIDSLLDPTPKSKITITIEEINLSRNTFTSLPENSLANFKSIDKLILSSNPLQNLSNDTFKSSKVKELDLSNCDLSQLTTSSLKGLESSLNKLDVSFNNLSTVDAKLFRDFKQLKTLNLEENKIKLTVEEILYLNKSSLVNLNLIGNPVLKESMKFVWKIGKLRSLRLSDLGPAAGAGMTQESFRNSSPSIEEIRLIDSKRKITKIGKNAFSSLPGLKYLSLYGTHITSIDDDAFSDVASSLIRLQIEHGLRMTSLPGKAIKKITSLRELDLSRNDLQTIGENTFNSDSNSHSNIEHINLRFNKINKINSGTFPSDKLPNLKRLLLGFNHNGEITSRSFHGLGSLEFLELNDNKISTIQSRAFVHLNELKILDLAGNQIKNLKEEAFQNLPRLQILDLSHNQLTEVDFDAFDSIGILSRLEIRLNNNKIKDLLSETEKQLEKQQGQGSSTTSVTEPTLEPQPQAKDTVSSFSGSMSTSTIEIIDLSNNKIRHISPDFFYPICNTVLDLDLSHNALSNLTEEHFTGMSFLQRLDLSYNNLSYLESFVFHGLNGIQMLTLNSNDIQEVPKNVFEDCCSKLRVLSLADNDLKFLDPDLLDDTPLEILDLSNNKFARFPSATLAKLSSSLVTLDMSGNQISQLELRYIDCLNSLRNLNLANNNLVAITYDAFDKITNLLHLDISNSMVDMVAPKFFGHIQQSLVSLNVSNVNMDGLPDLHFPKLISIDASDNQIRQIPVGFWMNYSQVKSVDFGGNRLRSLHSLNVDGGDSGSGSGSGGTGFLMLNHLSLGNNNISSIDNNTFSRLNRVDLLDLSNTTVDNLKLGILKHLSLETLIIGPRENGDTISKLLLSAPTVKHLHFLSDGKPANFDQIPLPAKLSKLTLSGPKVDISKLSFEGLRSKELELVLENTGIVELPSKFYDKLGSVSRLKITIEESNSALKTISNPNKNFRPTSSRTYLVDLDLDENLRMSCSCTESGWMKHWLGHWMQGKCSVSSSLNQFLECQEKLRSFRELKCRDSNKDSGSTLSQSFVNSDCGWENSAKHLSVNLITVFFYVSSSFLVGKLVY